MTFDAAFERLLGHEGGYTDDSALGDTGGKTKYGITERVARECGYLGDMKDLGLPFAKRIYRMAYWERIYADDLHPVARYAYFDAAVNSGTGQAIRWMQRALGVADDGRIGPLTLAAMHRCEPEKVLRSMLGQRLSFMTDLSIWPAFGRGWARRIAKELMA